MPGTKEAYVGITGAGSALGTKGAQYVFKVKLDPAGSSLGLYAGQHATGKKDMRDGGAGYISGGTGGKSSTLGGTHGDGGGGGGGGGYPLSGTGGGSGTGKGARVAAAVPVTAG